MPLTTFFSRFTNPSNSAKNLLCHSLAHLVFQKIKTESAFLTLLPIPDESEVVGRFENIFKTFQMDMLKVDQANCMLNLFAAQVIRDWSRNQSSLEIENELTLETKTVQISLNSYLKRNKTAVRDLLSKYIESISADLDCQEEPPQQKYCLFR